DAGPEQEKVARALAAQHPPVADEGGEQEPEEGRVVKEHATPLTTPEGRRRHRTPRPVRRGLARRRWRSAGWRAGRGASRRRRDRFDRQAPPPARPPGRRTR